MANTANDFIIKENENDFVKEYCTDALHKKIIEELTTRKKGEKGGRKITLTAKTLRDFLFHVSEGINLKTAILLVGISENTRSDWHRKSETFSRVTSLAEENVGVKAMHVLYRSMVGTKPGYYQIIHPSTNKPEYIFVKDTPPNVSVAQWYVEKKKLLGEPDAPSGAPQLGAPRNEEEAKLMELMLNKHYDYVKARQSQK